MPRVELTRFQQLRPAQKIADEAKRHIGLSLYPDDALSDLANALRDATTSAAYAAVVKRHDDPNGQRDITDVQRLPPVVRDLYSWLDFKSRPIKVADFKSFVSGLPAPGSLKLEDEWRNYADQLLLAIERGLLQANTCIDLQLLIRVCHLIRRGLALNENRKYELAADVSEALLDQILTRPIVLPPRLLNGRCREHCRDPKRMEIPKGELQANPKGRNPCECSCDQSCRQPGHFCICIRPYVADLFVIKEELARFEAGDIADIENILAGEKKARRHRTLLRSETSNETETETITSEERDHEVNEKFTLQAEVKNTVESKVNVDAGVTATFKYGESITITPHANVVANYSKSESQNIARSYAKDVVDRSISKVQEKVRKVQISKILNEVEEKNLHSIDNTQAGAVHRAGIYYWVNKVSHAQVFNYGKHMMFDAVIPEPAALFKKLYQLKLSKDKATLEPPKPDITPQSVQPGTYGTLLNKYAIATTDEIQPPATLVCVPVAFSQNVTEPADDKTVAFSSNEFKADIPKGYRATRMDFDIRSSTGHPKGTDERDEVALSVNVGNTCVFIKSLNEFDAAEHGRPLPLPNENWSSTGQHAMMGEEGSITVAVAGFSSMALSLSGSISITCELTPAALEKWQAQVYNLVMADYNRKLEAYKNSINDDDPLIQIKGRNPFLNREIERNELKRNIIALLMCNYFNGMGSMMERVAPCGYPEIDFEKLAADAPVIQFFEQVFEWEYMNYLFYHSMWARKCKWPDLIDEDSGDPLFDKFLMSGAARVQVPIRPGMQHIFSFFLKTGRLWGSTGQPPVAGDDDYVSMIQELKEAENGDYSDRPGLIAATEDSNVLALSDSTYYWDLVNDAPNALNIANDIDRELLVNFKVYRIVKVEAASATDHTLWNITIDPPYEGPTASNLKHATGAVFVGAPWEVVVPTQLVYLRNPNDKLPVYPLT